MSPSSMFTKLSSHSNHIVNHDQTTASQTLTFKKKLSLKNKFKKLLIFSLCLLPLYSLSAQAATKDQINKIIQKGCVNAAAGGLVTCDPITQGPLFNLYQASVAQGAVVTFLDEPLGSKNIIQVMRICTYKNAPGTPTGGANYAIKLNSCTESYVEQGKCNKVLNKFQGADKLKTTGTNNDLYVRCQTKQYIVASSGAGLAQKYLGMIYRFGTGIAGIIAILVIMFNGIKIIVSGSNDSAMSDAKTQITQSLLALAVLFMSGFILYIINPNFFT